ncbi:alanine racemase [Acuticoccus sediminis]|uniref:alanine racemase n=1 Tax=Acuticoccus sediminis TaxID=2184697 RepID=UPI001CFE2007|nr:alanine racemase [Acuticoccus sediminis]
MSFLRPATITIDLDALAHNVGLYRRVAGSSTFFAVIKGDGYGIGIVAAARTCLAAGADAVALGNPDDVAALRQAGIDAPMLLYASTLPQDAADVAALGVMPTIHDRASLDAFAATGRRLDVWVKVDCGLGRLGFARGTWHEAFAALAEAKTLRLAGVYTHVRDTHDPVALAEQGGLFNVACAAASGAGFSGFSRMLASSRVVLERPELHFDAINPGKGMYGYGDPDWAYADEIRPVVAKVAGRVIQVKTHPAGTVFYGDSAPLDVPRVSAVVPMGHCDGFNHRPPCGEVIVAGRRCPIVARRGIEHTVVDVTGVDAAVGDEAVFIGSQGAETITLAEVAAVLGVHPPELIARIARMAPREYLPASAAAARQAAE